MDVDLAAFLGSITPSGSMADNWGPLQFEVIAYLTPRLPLLGYVTSVRAIVTHGASVLVVRDPERTHILPGGRREAGESLLETLRRELLEETGWSVADIRQLGIMHFHHLTPEPPEYPYPFPDFIQAVFIARADQHLAHLREAGGYEIDAQFRASAEARSLPLTLVQRIFLDAALATR